MRGFDKQNQRVRCEGQKKTAFLTFDSLPSRAVESMLQAGHSGIVLVDTMDELP